MANYYFITYMDRELPRGKRMKNDVLDIHPFKWLKERNFDEDRDIAIVFWRPISKGEFELW